MTTRTGRFGWRAAYLLAGLCVYLADQATKAWVAHSLRHGGGRTVIDNVLYFDYAENRSIAFTHSQDVGEFGRWLLVVLAALSALAVLVYFLRTARDDDRLLGACALLLAGISGNLTDRFRLGYVIDFIEVQLGSYEWPTFNVADSAICLGAFLLALDLLLEGRRERASLAATSPKSARTRREEARGSDE